jgi:hypothetical protein
MPSSGILHRVEWYFLTVVSGQITGPIFKGQEDQEEKLQYRITTQLCVITQKSADIIYIAAEA